MRIPRRGCLERVDPGRPGPSEAAYAPGAVLVVPMRGEVRGSEAIRRYEDGIRSAFPQATLRLSCLIARGRSVAVEWEYSGTNTGPMVMPGGVVAPTYRRLTLRGASFLRYTARGLIAEERRYYDVGGVLEQLGIS